MDRQTGRQTDGQHVYLLQFIVRTDGLILMQCSYNAVIMRGKRVHFSLF